MKSNYIKHLRLEFVMRDLKDCVFLTLTTRDVVDFFEIRRRWRVFQKDYFRRDRQSRYVQTYEEHPGGHGWHIHVIIERKFIKVERLRMFTSRAKFGRIHIEKVNDDECIQYLAKYITKQTHSTSDGYRYRMLNLSRSLTSLNDIEIKSDFLDRSRLLINSDSPLPLECSSRFQFSRSRLVNFWLKFDPSIF